MAADLYIHAMGDGMHEHDLACFNAHTLGSKHFSLTGGNGCRYPHDTESASRYDCQHRERVTASDAVWIGEVSWLKAMLTEDGEAYIPDVVQQVYDLVGKDLPVLDEELAAKIMAALGAGNTTGYDTASGRKAGEVREWLGTHMGQRLFTVSW